MPPEMLLNLRLFTPEVAVVSVLILLFAVDAIFKKARENFVPLVGVVLACVLGAIATCSVSHETPTLFFSGMLAHDSFGAFFRYFFFFTTAASAYLAFTSKEIRSKSRMEFSILTLCVLFGMSVMALSTNLLMLYLGIETVSIVSFVLAGFNRDDVRSNEASFKYLVFGALASGVMIYGFSLIYGLTGSLQYQAIGKFLVEQGTAAPGALIVATVLMYAGLAYKISAFPMHFWTPDVYEGSPTPIATFFSLAPKAAGMAAFIRIVKDVYLIPGAEGQYTAIPGVPVVQGIAVIAALTMIVGNLSAIGQRNVKRMMAYSSIAHVGYMLMGLVSLNTFGFQSVLFYLVVYCAMNLGAFWVVGIVADLKGSEELEAFKGLGWSMPVLGICMAVFLFSLTGIPIFAGFIGKFILFSAILKNPGYLWLAIIGVLNSVVSLYYYSKVVKAMWLDKPTVESPRLPYHQGVGLVLLAIPTVFLGVYFTPVLKFVERALQTVL